MRASKKARNPQRNPTSISSSTRLPDDIRHDIAMLVRQPTLVTTGGNCRWRTMLGRDIMAACGLQPKLVCGSLLYRAGPDELRDVVAFCHVGNVGKSVSVGVMYGHMWLELDGEIIDFTCGDWQREGDFLADIDNEINPRTGKPLGRVVWQAPPSEYLWQRAGPLKASWRVTGCPKIGDYWYGPWVGELPDTEERHWAHEMVLPALLDDVERLDLKGRVNLLSMT